LIFGNFEILILNIKREYFIWYCHMYWWFSSNYYYFGNFWIYWFFIFYFNYFLIKNM